MPLPRKFFLHFSRFYRKAESLPQQQQVAGCNWPIVKFWLILWSNWLLIDFFDPDSWSQSESSRQNWFQQLRNASKILNLIKRDQFYIVSDQKDQNSQNILTFSIKFDFFHLLIDFSALLIDFQSFNQLEIKNWLKSINFNWKKIKIDQICN